MKLTHHYIWCQGTDMHPLLMAWVLFHTGSMPPFPLDFVFSHTEFTHPAKFVLSLQVTGCYLPVVQEKCNHFAFLVFIIIVELV